MKASIKILITKTSLLLSMILVISLITIEVQSQEGNIVLNASWGEGENEVGIIDMEELERSGPLSFDISESGEEILLLDTINRRVLKKVGENQLKTIAKNVVGWAICDDKNNGFFIQGRKGLRHYSEKGDIDKDFAYQSRGKIIEGYGSELTLSKDNILELNNVDQKAIALVGINGNGEIKQPEKGNKITAEGRAGNAQSELRFKIKRISGKNIRILGSDADGKILVTVPLKINGDKIGAVLFKGQDGNGNLYVEIERIINNRAKLEVHRYSQKGELRKLYKLPNNYYTTVYKKTQITPKGDVYQMLTTEKGLTITCY